MRRFTVLLTGALMLLGSHFISSNAQSQVQSTQDKNGKIKVKDDRVVVRDKSKPVRHALEAQYAKIAEAQINKDIEALRAIRTPDFSVDLPNGQKWDLETSLNYSRAGFAQVESNISLSNTIENLDVSGNALPACEKVKGPVVPPSAVFSAPSLQLEPGECGVAVAVVHQRWSRMQMKAGKLRRIDTEAIQTETWVNTADGWKLKHIGDVKPGAWYVDGKRIDPSKPYDPNAPEYKPD